MQVFFKDKVVLYMVEAQSIHPCLKLHGLTSPLRDGGTAINLLKMVEHTGFSKNWEN